MPHYKERCFRCKGRVQRGLYITIRKRGSGVAARTHPLCLHCAISFWRWADQVETMIAYESLKSMKADLRDRARELKRREAAVRRRERRLGMRKDEDEVIARVH